MEAEIANKIIKRCRNLCESEVDATNAGRIEASLYTLGLIADDLGVKSLVISECGEMINSVRFRSCFMGVME